MNLNGAYIESEKDYSSDLSLIVIGEYHYKKDVQLEVFDILNELKDLSSFDLLFLEGRKKGIVDWSSFPHKEEEIKDLRKFYGNLDEDLDLGKKKSAKYIFGYLNRKTVKTYGGELFRIGLLREEFKRKDIRCMELSLKEYYDGPKSLTEREKEELGKLRRYVDEFIIEKASIDMVNNSLDIMKELNKKLAVLVVGGSHKESIESRLNELRVSHKYITPKSYDNYTVLVKYYLAIKKEDKLFK